MARTAYVLLGTGGVVEQIHTPAIARVAGASPDSSATGVTEVETLIGFGYVAKREIPLDGGKVLLVMEKP